MDVKDPLAGWRQLINDQEVSAIWWPSDGRDDCPVKVGETFNVRVGGIEITRTHRARKEGDWIWRAEFTLYVRQRDRLYLLDHRGGYADNPKGARRWHEDKDTITTLCVLEPDPETGIPPRDPPEPEGIPPRIVESLPSTLKAKANYATERTKIDERRAQRSLVEEIRTSKFSVVELEQLRAFAQVLREARDVAA